MANETVITVVGNLTADPELRYTQGGVPVANFTIAATPRFFDKNSNEWKDGETLFMRCSVWREFAENVAGSLHKGDRVVATGTLKPNTYETAQGEKRTTMQLDVDEIGPSLKRATAQVARTASERGQGGANSTLGGQYAPTEVQGAPGADPWNASTPTYDDSSTPF